MQSPRPKKNSQGARRNGEYVILEDQGKIKRIAVASVAQDGTEVLVAGTPVHARQMEKVSGAAAAAAAETEAEGPARRRYTRLPVLNLKR